VWASGPRAAGVAPGILATARMAGGVGANANSGLSGQPSACAQWKTMAHRPGHLGDSDGSTPRQRPRAPMIAFSCRLLLEGRATFSTSVDGPNSSGDTVIGETAPASSALCASGSGQRRLLVFPVGGRGRSSANSSTPSFASPRPLAKPALPRGLPVAAVDRLEALQRPGPAGWTLTGPRADRAKLPQASINLRISPNTPCWETPVEHANTTQSLCFHHRSRKQGGSEEIPIADSGRSDL